MNYLNVPVIILLFILVGVIILLKVICFLLECPIIVRIKPVVLILYSGEVDRFLVEIEKDINRVRGKKLKNLLLLNKSTGLAYRGDFEAALDLLHSLDVSLFRPQEQVIYHNNLLSNLLLAAKLVEAEELVVQHPDIFTAHSSDQIGVLARRGTFATYQFYQGNLTESQQKFEATLAADQPPIFRAMGEYFLGLIYLKQGRDQDGMRLLESAAELGRNTFIAGRVSALKQSRQNSAS